MKTWQLILLINTLGALGFTYSYAGNVRSASTPARGNKLTVTDTGYFSEKLVPCSALKEEGQMCKIDSTHQCFQMVKDSAVGIGIQEMGDNCEHKGAIWGRQLNVENVNFDDPKKKCPDGSRPPRENEFKALRDSVDTKPNPEVKLYYATEVLKRKDLNENMLSDQGRTELYSLLPNIKGHRLWSSSTSPNGAFYFNPTFGFIESVHRHLPADVLCLRPARTQKLN